MEGKLAELSLNLFVLQLALVFAPGLLWARMNSAFVLKRDQGGLEFLVSAFLYGLISYVIVFLGFAARHIPFQLLNLAEADKKFVLTGEVAREVALALGAGLTCALINVYLSTYSLPFRFLRWIKATKRYGSEDVWDYTFNLNSANVEYVHVRDFDQKLVYAGWVNAFSETDRLRELTLRDVQVYDFEGALFYEVPRIYLARKPESVHIEFPAQPLQEPSDGPAAPQADGE